MNFNFAHPLYLGLLLLLPLLAWVRARKVRESAFLYSSVTLLRGVANLKQSSAQVILIRMRWLTLILCILAMARPRLSEGTTSIKASGVDIVVALDLSMSMAAMDFLRKGERVNRLDIAKDVLEGFVQKRTNDRLGLVAFAGRAYIAAPLTLDHSYFQLNLERLKLGIVEDGTAIGSALTATLNRLRDVESKSRIVILMTDGQNNAGKIPPLTAAEAAEALGVKIYTIGVGTKGTAPYPRKDAFGRNTFVQVQVDIDEDTLKEIATSTGGKYYRADNSEALRQIYDEIDALEKTEVEMQQYTRHEELSAWFLLPALILLLFEIILNNTVWRKLP
jgi:Ca-activated chloride channel homolog